MPKYDLVRPRFLVLSLVFSVCFAAPAAFAKGTAESSSSSEGAKQKKKILVGGFTGTKSAQARSAVIAALKDDGGYDVVDSNEIRPGASDKEFANASDGAAAVLVGTVKKSGLVLSIHNGADGALLQDLEITGETAAKLNKAIGETLGTSIADPLAQAKAAAPKDEAGGASDDSAKPEEGSDAPAEAETASAETAAGVEQANILTPLELNGGLRAVHRGFSYHDTPAQLFPARTGLFKAPAYNLPLGPALYIDVTVYPLAFGSRGAGAMFGLTGGYESNIATRSVYGNPEHELTTRASQFYVGVKGRIPFASHELGIVAAYGQQEFKLLGDESNPQVPDVLYKFVKLGAEGRFRFDALTLGLHLGTRIVQDTGALQHAPWFPNRVKTQALEAGLSAGYGLTTGLDVIFGLDLTRYAFNFNPQPAGANPYKTLIAGGGVDQYVAGSIGLRYSLTNHAAP